MVLVNEKDVYVPLGTVVLKIPLKDCKRGKSAEVAKELCDAAPVQHVDPTADPNAAPAPTSIEALSCFAWSETTLHAYRGTQFHQRVSNVQKWAKAEHAKLQDEAAPQERFMKALAEVYRRVAPMGAAGIKLPNGAEQWTVDPEVMVLPCELQRIEHHHEPTCAWVVCGEELQLIAARDVDAGEEFTVFYGQHSSAILRYAFNAKAPSRNPHESLEVSFEIPPFAIPALQSFFDEAANQAQKDNLVCPADLSGHFTKHQLTLQNPCPHTLLLSTRIHLGPGSTDDAVSQKIETVLVAMKESIFSGYGGEEGGHVEVRQVELNLVIAAVSRMSHLTTLRKGGACHRIVREPPTLAGETLAGVPLAKCLCAATAAAQPALEERFHFLNEQQLVAAQAAVMRSDIKAFMPDVENFALYWSDAEKAELKGTTAGATLAQLENKLSGDVALLKEVGIEISEEDYKWGFALRNGCGVSLAIPEETVRIDVTRGKAQPVSWEDEDSDRIKIRFENGKLLYSVNEEDRPPIEKIVIEDGVTLKFPLIDREIDLPPPGQAKEAYEQILSTVRALAEAHKVNHSIPPIMEFSTPGKTQELIVPGAAKLPHLSTGFEPVYNDKGIWYFAAGGEDDLTGAGVVHLPHAGDGEVLARRGEMAPEEIENPNTHVPVVLKIPCRELGAEESAEDIHQGAVLQACNLIQQSGSREVEVQMPDLEQLQAGVKGLSFTIIHRVTKNRPVPKALLYAALLQHTDRAVVVAARAALNDLEGMKNVVTTNADFDAAFATIKDMYSAAGAAFPGTEDDDVNRLAKEMKQYSRTAMALRVRMQEREVVSHALSALDRIKPVARQLL
eukprot:TRINITY_DN24615_c0_g1_i1.p1 TRINITY_DN24615_c0_g1~~TRINITY_DN24615_c0_g1_i1.p1  ORF type:complete len:843 (+),score=422.06 TRINITY_DN24615_c0_g1_i1:54-2582(+)